MGVYCAMVMVAMFRVLWGLGIYAVLPGLIGCHFVVQGLRAFELGGSGFVEYPWLEAAQRIRGGAGSKS